ncbi:MAG TPA: hypothetical protein ENI59_01025 [Euryarchaeota archaeon]|nr:hypothetical protein [Euryarchaeota archaeon]
MNTKKTPVSQSRDNFLVRYLNMSSFRHVVLDTPYKYYDNNLEELKGKALLTVCLEFVEKA